MTWPQQRFGDLYAETSRNGVYKPKEFHGSGARIVNMGELFAARVIGDMDMARLRVTDEELGRFSLRDGDLLFARRSLIEAGAGRCVLVAGVVEPTVFESSIIRVRLDPELCNPRFYLYYLGCAPGRHRIEQIITGTAQKGIRGSELQDVVVHVPPRDIQDRIARVVADYDELIAANERRMALLEDSVHLLYREWFGRLRFPGHEWMPHSDGVPGGWTRAAAGEAIEFNPRTAVKAGDEAPFAPMASLATTGMTIDPIERRVPSGGARFMNGDTLLARITPCLENGKTGFVQFLQADEAVATGSTEFIVMREGRVPATWVYCLARSEAFRQYAINHLTGSDGRQRVSADELAAYPLLLPSASVLDEWDRFARPRFEAVHVFARQNAKLREARDYLLPRLMSGQLAA